MQPAFNKFVSYTLTETEQLIGETYNEYQLAVLQNRRSQAAADILALQFKPSKSWEFVQNEATLKGQLQILDWQIAMHHRATDKLKEVESEKPSPEVKSE